MNCDWFMSVFHCIFSSLQRKERRNNKNHDFCNKYLHIFDFFSRLTPFFIHRQQRREKNAFEVGKFSFIVKVDKWLRQMPLSHVTELNGVSLSLAPVVFAARWWSKIRLAPTVQCSKKNIFARIIIRNVAEENNNTKKICCRVKQPTTNE